MRRLQKLKVQSATYGISADPGIGLEIEDIKKKIEDLQAELSIHNSANHGVPSDSKILIEIKNIEKKIETLQRKSQGVESIEEIKPTAQSCYVNLGKVSAAVIFLSLLIMGTYSLIYSWQTNYQATQTAIALAAITPTDTLTATPKNFSYLVSVQAKETGENIRQAKIIIQVPGKAPLDEVTDSTGLARISIEASHIGQPSKLIVKATGYEQYVPLVFPNWKAKKG